MYETFFEFTGRPFAAVPCVDQYFPAGAIEAARGAVGRCLERGDGAALVVGPSGTGKTLLCHVLARQLADSYQVVLLGAGHLGTRRALLQAILFELRQPYRDMDEGELRLALFDYLGDEQRCPDDMVLLVDEAHTLSLRLLEELRMVTNQIHAARPRVRLALVGGPVLEERLASPRLDSLSQRTVVRGYVQAMEGCETDQYISAQIEAVGGTADALFPVEARRRVHRATDGIPRLVNQVCDHALLLACAGGRRQITADGIEEAWADLQQLPTPWNGEADHADQSAEGVVEFGGLDDEPVDIGTTEPTEASPMAETTPTAEEIDPMPVDSTPVDPEPTEQLDHIESHLSRVEDEWQPAGSIGPEVELSFDDQDDPFAEDFDAEQCVVDRYGIRCDQQQDAPLDQPADQASHGQAEESMVDLDLDAEDVPLEAEEPASPVAADPPPRTISLYRSQPTDPTEVADPAEVAGGAREGLEDDDLIIVEEGHDVEYPPVRPITTVRKQEYRQLFAKLRRG